MAFERSALNKTGSKILFDYPQGLEDRAEIAEFIEPIKAQIIEGAKAQNIANAGESRRNSIFSPTLAIKWFQRNKFRSWWGISK